MNNINENELYEFIEEFKIEIINYIEEIEEILSKLKKFENYKENFHELFRKIHTIKGMSGFIDFKILSFISDSVEDILVKCRSKKMKFNKKIESFILEYCSMVLIIINDVNIENNNKFKEFILSNFDINFKISLIDKKMNININTKRPVLENKNSNFTEKLKIMSDSILEKVKYKIDLHLNIGEINTDKKIENKILQIIMHIIRNSISHGIEDENERKDKGKTQEGNIYLDLSKNSSKIIIEIKDDGKGIDLDIILKRAKDLNLIDNNKKYSSLELLNFIFEPGFSTMTKSDELSGRGVGLDFVKKTVDELNGEIDIINKIGIGTKMIIKIPVN